MARCPELQSLDFKFENHLQPSRRQLLVREFVRKQLGVFRERPVSPGSLPCAALSCQQQGSVCRGARSSSLIMCQHLTDGERQLFRPFIWIQLV